MRLKYIRNNDPVKIDQARCTGCGICAEVCPHGIISIADGKAYPVNAEYCMGCGGCLMNCPAGAIAVGTGVGCAAAVFNSILPGKRLSACECSCSVESEKTGTSVEASAASVSASCCGGAETSAGMPLHPAAAVRSCQPLPPAVTPRRQPRSAV